MITEDRIEEMKRVAYKSYAEGVFLELLEAYLELKERTEDDS